MYGDDQVAGPLSGLRIIELASIGPGPFCCMMLADHGAEVITVHRPDAAPDVRDPLMRSRRYYPADLKAPEDHQRIIDLIKSADGLVEGFRPGVLERLGLAPDMLHRINPKLVIGRMTGWGQTGPLAHTAGHDINFIALSGALHSFGRAGEQPTPPINMVGDFGGGGMLLAFAMCAAMMNAAQSGVGDVIDCAMTEGSSVLMSMIWGLRATAGWKDERGVNSLDTGAHFYDTFETSDCRHIAIGSYEPQFYGLLLDKAGLNNDPDFADQLSSEKWPRLKKKLAARIKTKSFSEWRALMEGTDVCFAPVLSMGEAIEHPHNVQRNAFITLEGIDQPAPAPRYANNKTAVPRRPVTYESEL